MSNIAKPFSILLLSTLIACGGSQQAAIEGTLVDWKGQPVPDITLLIEQVQPIKGFEKFEAVTGTNGSFHVEGLYPSSQYLLRPVSDAWRCETEVRFESAPRGETSLLREPVVIAEAYSTATGSPLLDLVSGTTRFGRSPEGVITDSETGLEWVLGPRNISTYSEAQQWVADCTVEGGRWRMPTLSELATLYLRSGRNPDWNQEPIDPVFQPPTNLRQEGLSVLAEPVSPRTAWSYQFYNGEELHLPMERLRDYSNIQVFGVR